MAQILCWGDRQFAFDPVTTCLIVVDMQHDFIAPADAVTSRLTDRFPLAGIVPNLKRVLATARRVGMTIVHTREGYAADGSDVSLYKRSLDYVGRPGPNGPFLIRGTPGHDFFDGFEPQPDEIVVDKAAFSAFYQTSLHRTLVDTGVTHLVLTGVTTQCCVHSTLRDAVERGYFCLTLEDCCAAEDPTVHAATMRIIQAENNLFGWISDSQAFIDAMPDPG